VVQLSASYVAVYDFRNRLPHTEEPMTDNCRAKQRVGASDRNSNYIKTRNAVAAFSSAVSAAVISGQIVALS
jgi:hypothetical protein